ncbi:MAG: 50S ribosomal protein L37ae [Candidatus Micrarchaeota archaeon]|nr:50S ribosomal protein L37ae [Candidatus Micrarchaeota archaeon]
MARFHVRGGAKWRKAHTKIYAAKRAKYACPTCLKHSVRRVRAGMWECRSCKSQFAGGAYELSTPVGRLTQRLISDLAKKGKVSEEEIKELELAMESAGEEPAAGIEDK